MDPQRKVKSFFERPEGKTGMIFIFLGILTFLFAGNYIMPFVITALTNTLHAALLGGSLLALIALGMNDKVRSLASSMFKSVMRFITGIFITIDPIGILKNYLDDMSTRLRKIAMSMAELNGQKARLDRTIADEERNARQALDLASSAKRQGNEGATAANTRKAARSQDFVKKLRAIREKMDFLSRVLTKMHSSVSFLKEDTADQIRVLEAEYRSVKAAHKAMKAAEGLVSDSSAKELFEQSAEFLAQDISDKLGEIDTFMTLSEGFMTKVDLQNGVWDKDGLRMLEEFERTGDIISYKDRRNNSGKVRVDNSPSNLRVVPSDNAQSVPTYTPKTSMSEFFRNN